MVLLVFDIAMFLFCMKLVDIFINFICLFVSVVSIKSIESAIN